MANTITNTVLHQNPKHVTQYLTLVSDGAEETDLVIYDSSARTEVDPTNCAIEELQGLVQVLDATAVDVSVKLEFDATTDVLALSLPINRPFHFKFRKIGGLKNYAGTGKTGDITLTTTGLESGDTITLISRIIPN